MKKQSKYLVRPHDSHVFEVDPTNGCYHSWSTRNSANRPRAYDHFTYENLTQNHNFFEIEESEIERYDKKNDIYHDWIGWTTRSDGHGGSKGGTFEEYVKKHNLHICDICGDAFSGKSFDVVNENFENEGLTQCERCYSENLLGEKEEKSKKYLFASDINNTCKSGIVEVNSLEIICYCNEKNSELILKALKNENKINKRTSKGRSVTPS